MNELDKIDPISPNDIYLSVPVRFSDKSNRDLHRKSDNQIFLSKEPVEPIILIQGLRFYYSPSDICNYVLSFGDLCYIASLLINAISPTFVLLLKTDSIESARHLMSNLKLRCNPICSMDNFDFQYVHSVGFKSNSLSQLYNDFRNSKSFFDGQCPICLNKLTSDQLLLFLPCCHLLHAKCMTKVLKWECPICRDTPISFLEATRCEICQSDEKLFICLCCSSTFCESHCHDHYEQKGHPYLSSADGRETWNMVTDSLMKRVAMDKSGEFVEMCAKEDSLGNDLDSALDKQIMMYQSLGEEKKKNELTTIGDESKELKNLILVKKKKIDMMKNSISEKEKKEGMLNISIQLLHRLQKRLNELPEENKRLKQENDKLEKNIDDMSQLIEDMKGTLNISFAASLTGPNEKIQVNIPNGNQQSPPPSPPLSSSPSSPNSSNKSSKKKRKS